MIVEYIRYDLDPSRAPALVEAYEAASKSLQQSPHCLGYELARCSEAPGSFVLRIEWDSLEGHLQGFRTSPHFRSFFTAVQPFVKDIAEMRHYEVTTLKWSPR